MPPWPDVSHEDSTLAHETVHESSAPPQASTQLAYVCALVLWLLCLHHGHADVEQSDIHMPRTTVHEALQISGLLRLHNTSRDVISVFVNEVCAKEGYLAIELSLHGWPT